MLQKKEWLNKLARGNQDVLLTMSLLQLERIVSYRALEIAGMKETYRSRQEKNISAESTHADLLSFLFFAKQCFLSLKSKTKQNI